MYTDLNLKEKLYQGHMQNIIETSTLNVSCYGCFSELLSSSTVYAALPVTTPTVALKHLKKLNFYTKLNN